MKKVLVHFIVTKIKDKKAKVSYYLPNGKEVWVSEKITGDYELDMAIQRAEELGFFRRK